MFNLADSSGSLAVLVFALGLAGIFKCISAVGFGEWGALEKNTFTQWKLNRQYSAGVARLVCATHKPSLIVRGLSGLALILGVAPAIASLVLFVALAGELAWRFRYNHILSMVCAMIVFCSTVASNPFLSGVHGEQWANLSGATRWIMVITTFSLYWSSCLEKVRSDSFSTGWTLRAIVIDREVGRRPGAPWEYPSVLSKFSRRVRGVPDAWFRLVAWLVICLEFLLPVLVTFEATYAAGVAMAIILHLAFVLLQPLHLFPFQALSLALLSAFPFVAFG